MGYRSIIGDRYIGDGSRAAHVALPVLDQDRDFEGKPGYQVGDDKAERKVRRWAALIGLRGISKTGDSNFPFGATAPQGERLRRWTTEG